MTSHKWLFAMNQGATFVAHRVQTVKKSSMIICTQQKSIVCFEVDRLPPWNET